MTIMAKQLHANRQQCYTVFVCLGLFWNANNHLEFFIG
jgi:hypothetical protein